MPRALSDITLNDARGNPILTINVSTLAGKTPEWAAEKRRNLVADGWLTKAPFFLLAFPDRFYLWKDAPYTQELIMPTYVIDPAPLLNPYYERLGMEAAPYSRTGFQMVLSLLFGQGRQRADVLLDYGQKVAGLTESGLLAALGSGRIDVEVGV